MTTKGAVVVTGTSSGIGKACALRLDQLGFRVFAGVRKAADGEALKRETSDRLVPIVLDITDAAAIAAAAETVAAATGEAGLAGLVNNAGIAVVGPLEFLSISEFRRQLEVSVIGQVAVTQAFLPLLRMDAGRIVYIGSMAGRLPLPFLGPYCAAKSALDVLTGVLRMELRPWGISVSLVLPGKVMTPIWETSTVAMSVNAKNFPQQAHDFYDTELAAVGDRERSTGAVPASVVAKTVVHALTSKRPKSRYVVGWDVKLVAVLLRFVTDRTREWLTLRRLGLLSDT
jgi:NAD(P)-dependent dehydrogenase (short-subunit alcohol dehydrogenase family)